MLAEKHGNKLPFDLRVERTDDKLIWLVCELRPEQGKTIVSALEDLVDIRSEEKTRWFL